MREKQKFHKRNVFYQKEKFYDACDVTRPSIWLGEFLSSADGYYEMSSDFSFAQHSQQVKGIFSLSEPYFLYVVH